MQELTNMENTNSSPLNKDESIKKNIFTKLHQELIKTFMGKGEEVFNRAV